MDFSEKTTLGRTGLKVGRLGVAASYGAPSYAFEKAFERGCNYFYWGALRRKGMRDAIRNICKKGNRDDLVIVIQSYSRSTLLLDAFFQKALKALAVDHADILLLGWHNKAPSHRIVDRALQMQDRGMFRFLGVSGHNRKLFPKLMEEFGIFDVFHIRYNAAHRGAETDIFPHLNPEKRPGIVAFTATRWGRLLKSEKMPPGEIPPRSGDCYRFVLTNPAVDVTICGPRDPQELDEGLETLDLGPMNEEEAERMRRIGDYVHNKP